MPGSRITAIKKLPSEVVTVAFQQFTGCRHSASRRKQVSTPHGNRRHILLRVIQPLTCEINFAIIRRSARIPCNKLCNMEDAHEA
jgi:hypothetical protein